MPADSEWLALFGGALTELTKSWNWQQSDGGISVEDTVQKMTEILTLWYVNTCDPCLVNDGDDLVSRLDEDGHFQVLEAGYWVPPSGDYAIPAVAARTEPTAQERRCLAAANAVYVLEQMYEEITDGYNGGLGVLETIANVVLVIGTIVAPYVALWVRALSAIGWIAWNIAFDAVAVASADYWNTAFSDNLKCIFYANSTDTAGVVTFDYDAIQHDLIANVGFDLTLGIYALTAQVRFMMAQVTVDGLNQAGTKTYIEEADCSGCADGWCYEWDLTVELGDWEIPVGAYGALGTWVSGQGVLFNVLSDAGFDDYATVVQTFPAVNVDYIQFLYYYTAGGTPLARVFAFDRVEAGTPVPQPECQIGGITASYEVPNDVTVMLNAAHGTGAGRIVKIKMGAYSGENPFGDDNCTDWECP